MFLSTSFGILLVFIGFVNSFWGNDPYLGFCIVLLSFFYLLPAANLLNRRLGATSGRVAKLLVGILVIWASLGVGELEDKLDLMFSSFPYPHITGI